MIYRIGKNRIANLRNADDIGVYLLNGTETFQLIAYFGKRAVVLREGTQDAMQRELSAIAVQLTSR